MLDLYLCSKRENFLWCERMPARAVSSIPAAVWNRHITLNRTTVVGSNSNCSKVQMSSRRVLYNFTYQSIVSHLADLLDEDLVSVLMAGVAAPRTDENVCVVHPLLLLGVRHQPARLARLV